MNFFCTLRPPRPSFAQDMSPDEQALMQQHAGYWQEWIGRGHVIAFGFVADPAGAFGMGIVDFESEADVHAFTEGDPTILAAAASATKCTRCPWAWRRPDRVEATRSALRPRLASPAGPNHRS